MTMLSADLVPFLCVYIVFLYFSSMHLFILNTAVMAEPSLWVRKCLVCLIRELVIAHK